MKLGILVQARLGSSRFPGKVAAMITANENLVEFVVKPILSVGFPVVIIFPETKEHRLFANQLQLKGVDYFFGSEFDLLDRYVTAAKHFGFTSVVRICGDNPCLNAEFLRELLEQWSEEFDYASFRDRIGTPAIRTHYGLFSEIAKVSSLEGLIKATDLGYHHEHVTPYFYENPQLFRICWLDMPEPFWSGISLRFTVDSEEDFALMRVIVAETDVQDVNDLLRICKRDEIQKVMTQEIARNSK